MKHLLTLLLILTGIVGWGQCDVIIVPGSVEVIDNEPGVRFQFDIQNNSGVPYNGGTLYMAWTLSSNDPIWEFTLTNPLPDGQTMEIITPVFDIPAVWDVDDYNLGVNEPTPANPWLGAQDWFFYGVPTPFTGSWQNIRLYLNGCTLFDVENVFDENGDPYYGPIVDGCTNNIPDQFCDLNYDIGLNYLDPFGFGVEILGDECYNLNTYPPTPGINVFVTNLSFGGPPPCGNINYLGFPTLYEGDDQYFDFYTYGIGNLPCADTVPIAFEEDCKVQLGISNPNQLSGLDINGSNNSIFVGTGLDCELLPSVIDIAVDTLLLPDEYLFGCTEETNDVYGYPGVVVTNLGETSITELCIKVQALGQTNDTICFTDLNIIPGETYMFDPTLFTPFTDAVVSVHILDVNGENPLNEFGLDNVIPNNMGVYTTTFTCFGCTDPDALNYNPYADEEFPTGSSCIYDIYGCTDPLADNYNSEATIDDGSCTNTIPGCTDPSALNFDPDATADDGSCEYPSQPDPCDDIEVFAPNTFTPNNDGLNDAWYVVTDKECWREWHVQIFNRWGSLVWESFNPDDVWTGSNNGSNYFVADGVYVYTITGNKWNTEAVTTSGHITILR